MHDAVVAVPPAVNEPVLGYAPGSPERAALKAELARQAREEVEIPCVVGGERVHTGRVDSVVMPHNHRQVIGRFHMADADVVRRAVLAAKDGRREWAAMRWEARAAVFLRAAELLATTWRQRLNAATMLGQS
jgi:1-pyrroline-5-carboxylate dehydrogenase